MDNNLHNDFEKFIRKEMEGLGQSPSDLTWDKIAAQQRPQNTWLKVRYYGKIAVPIAAVVLMAFGLIWWRPLSNDNNLAPANESDVAFVQAFFAPAPVNHRLQPTQIPMAAAAQQIPLRLPGHHINSFPAWYRQNNVPVDRIRFIAEEGMRYQSPVSGNSVSIPANSLVYADGTPVQGEAELFFREYRTIPDILAADIPMHYTDQRGDFFFNSGGMFDIRVSQNNQELFMAPGLAYDFNFNASTNLSKTSLFYFEEDKNNWDFVSDKAFDESAKSIRNFDVRTMTATDRLQLPPVSNEATVIRENTRTSDEDACLPVLPAYPTDANKVQWVKAAVELGKDLAYGKRLIPKWFKVNPRGTDTYFAIAMDRSEIQLVYGKDRGTRFFPQDINGLFTELNALKNCYFLRTSDTLSAIQEEMGANSVDAVFNNTAIWHSIEVEQDKNDKCFIILRQTNGDAIRIHARICSSTEDGKDANFNPDVVIGEYRKLRAKRLAGMSKELETLRRFMAVSPMFQSEKEWCMRQKDWLKYFEENLPLMRARYDGLVRDGMSDNDVAVQNAIDNWDAKSRSLVFDRFSRSAGKMNTGQKLASLMRLTGFGAYNCDQIYQLAQSLKTVNAHFKTALGANVEAASVRILDADTKMFFTLNSAARMYAFPGRKLEIMVTGKDGRIYYMPGAAYAQLLFSNKNSIVFTVEDITERVQSPMGWAEVLQI